MNTASDAPEARTYVSQGLRLHYTDWGNESAPPLILVHGGLDQSRSWDAMARALRATFHIVAPDLRGPDWATGSSYSLSDHVYDLTCLIKSAGLEQVAIVSHSMGGMVSLTYAGAFPEKVSRLAVLDGVTNFPARKVKPIDVRHVVHGQYEGYRSEPGVAPDSDTETMVAVRAEVDNWRWHGVPFYLRSGKAMWKRGTEVVVQFKRAPGVLFRGTDEARLAANRLGPARLALHPAPSSVALAFARIGIHWDDAKVVSAHGRPILSANHAPTR